MITCPDCRKEIPREDFNVATDVAYCSACEKNFPYHELIQQAQEAQTLLHGCPPGMREIDTPREKILRYKKFRMVSLLFVFFALFWNGIVSVFVVGLLSGTAEVQGDVKLLPYLLIPFILVGIGMFGAALYLMFGRQEIRISGGTCAFWRGISGLGFARRFKLADVQDLSVEERSTYVVNGRPVYAYVLAVTLRNGDERVMTYSRNPAHAEYAGTFIRRYLPGKR